MKRLTALLLVLCMPFCFAGCGGEEKKIDDKKVSSQTSTGKESKYDKTVELNLKFDDFYEFEDVKDVKIEEKEFFKYSNKKIHAIGITKKPTSVIVTTSSGKKILYKISIAKTKINIAIVAGQSNGSGEITGIPDTATKYTQTVCKPGTAFLWKETATLPLAFNGGGNAANGTGTGICSSLARQWVEQKAEAGSDEKVTLVFAKNHTATPSVSLDQYLNESMTLSNGQTGASLRKTIELLNKCYDYYEKGAGSKGYEIVSCGMYWFQGESDGKNTPKYYYDKFSELWSKLKSGTNNRVKYCSFMRVRVSSYLDVRNSVVAQYKLANDFDDIYMGSTLTEQLTGGKEDKVTLDVSNYRVVDEDQYSSIVSNNKLTEIQGNIYGGLHYSCLGYNLLGADAAYNMIKSLNSPSDNATLVDTGGKRLANITFGGSANVNASDITGDVYAYKDAGSSGTAVSIKVISGNSDITASVLAADGYMFDGSKIKASNNVKIVITCAGKAATFNIIK